MKSLKLILVFFSLTALFLIIFSCSEKTDNPLRTSNIGILEQPQIGDNGGLYRMTPVEPFIPIVVRTIKWRAPQVGLMGGLGIAYDGRLFWLGGGACPWDPSHGHFYGVNFCPSEEKHFTSIYGNSGLAWDGNYLWASSYYCDDPGRPPRIYKISTNGQVISYFNTSFLATGLDWDGQYLWAIDYWARSFKKFNSSGIVIDSVIPEIPGNSPLVGLAYDGNYFWCSNNGKIYKISQEGSILQSFNQPGATVCDLAWCGQCLLILDNSSGYNTIFVVQVSKCNCPLNVFEYNSID